MDQRIQQAIHLAKSGQREAARTLIASFIKENPESASAWYLLAPLVENPEQKIYCLEKVLEIEPGNPLAEKRLEEAKHPSSLIKPAEPIAPPPQQSIPQLQQQQPQSHQPQPQIINIEQPKKKPKASNYLVAIILPFLLICFCFVVFTFFERFRRRRHRIRKL